MRFGKASVRKCRLLFLGRKCDTKTEQVDFVLTEPVTFPLSTKETRKYESGYEEIDGIVD